MINSTDFLSNTLKGKKILFVGVKFYYFNDEIISKLKKYGSQVTFFYERDISFKYGLAKSISPKYANSIQVNHYHNIIKKINHDKFDYLFVIRGFGMEPWFVEKLKINSPNLKTILYQWDAFENWECDYRYLIPYFDVVKTFDYKDSLSLNLPYVPTFHTDDFKDMVEMKPKYDLFFSGGYSYPRYEFLKLMNNYAQLNNIKIKTHLAISFKFYLKELFSGRKLNSKILSFRKMNKQEYLNLFQESNIIVDYANERQSGITMRTLDALGAGKKVLTTNDYIKMEPGYNPDQIQIFNPKKFEIPEGFLSYLSFPKQDYSIDKWLEAIFR